MILRFFAFIQLCGELHWFLPNSDKYLIITVEIPKNLSIQCRQLRVAEAILSARVAPSNKDNHYEFYIIWYITYVFSFH